VVAAAFDPMTTNMNRASAIALLWLSIFVSNAAAETQKLSPAEQKMQWAQKAIEKDPGRFQSYNDLALALARRARETSDDSYYLQAEAALKKSFELNPGNLEGEKVQVWVLLGKHEFAQALKLASSLNQKVPDDVLIYGFLVDANVELGNYADAEKAAQWMLDIRPGNVPGLTRAAYLRELFGDLDGASDLMRSAYQQVQPTEVEDRAWMLTQLAHLRLIAGGVEDAEKLLRQALGLFPNYHYALGNLARVHSAKGDEAEAITLLRQRYELASHPENAYALAESLQRAGRSHEARKMFLEFEAKARQEVNKAANANRELVFYYADHVHKPAEALRIAKLEIARRRDAHTVDAYAWALYVNGRYTEARKQIESALSVGVKDAKMLCHAGAMSLKCKDRSKAFRYWKQSLDLNPTSECSALVRSLLG
jgi:tetratricopeptide (TPR) repeat protein